MSGSRLIAIVGLLALMASARANAQVAQRGDFVPLGPEATAPALDRPISISVSASLRFVLARIAAQASLSLTFDDSLPGLDRMTVLNADRLPARHALDRVLNGSPLQALVSPSGQIVLVRRPPRVTRSAHVAGTVRDAESGAPIASARVELVGTRFSAYSEQDGSFDIRLPAGDYSVRVNRIGYEPILITSVRVVEEQSTPLAITMRRGTLSLSEIVVTPGYFGLLQSSLAAPQSLSREQLETIPQIGEDIYRAVSRLPGVSADDFSAKFSVRGGSGDELYVTLDGLELVEPFHLKDVGGSFSIIDIQALGTASLTTGGFSAEYGDRLSGVFALNTTDPRTDRVHTSVGVSLMNARATSQGGFAKGKGGWLVSLRPGFLDLALKLTDIRDSLKPRYYDLFAKAQYDLGRGGKVALHALRADDSFRYLQNDEPNIFSRYASTYGWLNWDANVGSRLKMRSVASVASLAWRRRGEMEARRIDELPEKILDDRSLDRIGLRQDWTLDVAPRLMFKWGFDAKRERASYDYFGAVTVKARDTLSVDRSDTTTVVTDPRSDKLALYFAPRVQLLPSLTVEVGVRYDRISHLNESLVSPRLNASWSPSDATTVRASWGKYTQSQALFGLQAEDGVATFPRSQRAEQTVLGVEQALPYGISARIEGYERRRTTSRSEYTNYVGDVLLFPEMSWDRIRVDRDGGRDRGIEFQAARSNGRRTDWSVSYALATAEDSIGGRMVPRNGDQRHAVKGDWSLRPTSNAWRLSVGGVWHSGWPTTPTTVGIDTIANTSSRFAINVNRTPGELNSLRLRAYRRIDARWTRYIDTRRGRVSLFGEVYNLLGTVNQRGIFRWAEVRGRNVVMLSEELTQWPRMPIAGFTWEF